MLRPHRREETAPLGSGLGAQGQDSSVVRPGSCSSLSRHRCGQSKNPSQLALSPAGSLHSIPCRPRHPSASPTLRLRGGSHPCVQPRLPIREARYPYRLPVGTSQADRDRSPMMVPLHDPATTTRRSLTEAQPESHPRGKRISDRTPCANACTYACISTCQHHPCPPPQVTQGTVRHTPRAQARRRQRALARARPRAHQLRMPTSARVCNHKLGGACARASPHASIEPVPGS